MQPVRGVGEAGAEPGGVILGLTHTVAVAEARPLGLQHRELLAPVEQHVVAGEALATFAAGLDASGTDHLAANTGAFRPAPAGFA